MAKVSFRVELPPEEKQRLEAERQASEALEAQKKQREQKQQQRQAKLSAIADKAKQGKITLDDINAKLDIIIDMLMDQ